jgi:rhodanese-related sulfurtransferase
MTQTYSVISASSKDAAHTISRSAFLARLGRADTPLILDVRRDPKFIASERIVAGAIRCRPEDVASFAEQHCAGEIAVYCVYGHELSTDAAHLLRSKGWDAKTIEGGIEGGEDGVDGLALIQQWRAQVLPTIRKRADLGVTGEQGSLWITRARPKIDRIACPWLVRRFIDPRAQFLYVPTDQVLAQAKALNAVAYDIPGAPISHSGPNGELCSFDALLAAFDLNIPALNALAKIVRGADTDALDLAPQSAGLLATSLGMSALHQDDSEMLAAMMPVYDALYAWCVQSTAGTAETHSWVITSS